MVTLIAVHSVDSSCYFQKGFDSRGCFGSSCNDACCRYGADVDSDSYDLIMEHKDSIENLTGVAAADWFNGRWSGDSDFLGGNSIRSNVAERGYCVFHVAEGRGCALYGLASQGIDRTIIPSICRLYPLSWDKGLLVVSEYVEQSCNCSDQSNVGGQSILESQIREVEQIFQIQEPRLK